MIYDAAVRISIKAKSREDAERRIRETIEWVGFDLEVVTVRPRETP